MLLNEESNKLTVGVSVEHEIFQDAMSGMTLVSSAAEERTFFRITSLNLHYYLSSRLSVSAVVPYKNITSPKTDLRTGIRFTRNYSGLGDVILHNRLLLNEPKSDRNPRFWLGLGLKLPTGDSRPDWDWGFGNSHDPVLQPGTGSLDQIFSTDYLQNLGDWFSVSGCYRAIKALQLQHLLNMSRCPTRPHMSMYSTFFFILSGCID